MHIFKSIPKGSSGLQYLAWQPNRLCQLWCKWPLRKCPHFWLKSICRMCFSASSTAQTFESISTKLHMHTPKDTPRGGSVLQYLAWPLNRLCRFQWKWPLNQRPQFRLKSIGRMHSSASSTKPHMHTLECTPKAYQGIALFFFISEYYEPQDRQPQYFPTPMITIHSVNENDWM